MPKDDKIYRPKPLAPKNTKVPVYKPDNLSLPSESTARPVPPHRQQINVFGRFFRGSGRVIGATRRESRRIYREQTNRLREAYDNFNRAAESPSAREIESGRIYVPTSEDRAAVRTPRYQSRRPVNPREDLKEARSHRKLIVKAAKAIKVAAKLAKRVK